VKRRPAAQIPRERGVTREDEAMGVKVEKEEDAGRGHATRSAYSLRHIATEAKGLHCPLLTLLMPLKQDIAMLARALWM
jgi:hypothetical protein